MGLKVVSRRQVLRSMGALGVAAGLLGGRVARAEAQQAGSLASLGPEESVDATIRRLFGGRALKDGSAQIKLDLPLIAENGAVVPVTVEVTPPASTQVRAIYVISDKNRRPLNAKFNFVSGPATPMIGTNLRLGESTDVRAVAELSDGTLLQAKREVKVTVGGCGG